MEAKEPAPPKAPEPVAGFRFEDPFWDDAFDTYYDPAMRVCSVFGGC